ncbi:MAG: 3-isopropylmalate dehydratase small subunit [candidate division Zixibacteria bacterium RBG-1]|nr:MAG: 3-isopropylmalate dehydratase small subunit [candidate division Zixibacteria bacterium RBG-1]OGC84821.1 MAG: 3-isopropylmalate dehydratase small subunit [candidate division Zixibacteria bacterium RBG_19FT_COMBO_42_43]
MLLKGKVWKYGENINTDVILPGRWCHLYLEEDLAKHCLEDLDPDFVKKASPGDIIVAGKNFGCGSSREIAPLAIKAAKVSCVIAPSFARIFYRNAINLGFPIFESDECYQKAETGDILEVDIATGVIANLTKNQKYSSTPFPEFMRMIIQKGGLKGYVLERMKNKT